MNTHFEASIGMEGAATPADELTLEIALSSRPTDSTARGRASLEEVLATGKAARR